MSHLRQRDLATPRLGLLFRVGVLFADGGRPALGGESAKSGSMGGSRDINEGSGWWPFCAQATSLTGCGSIWKKGTIQILKVRMAKQQQLTKDLKDQQTIYIYIYIRYCGWHFVMNRRFGLQAFICL